MLQPSWIAKLHAIQPIIDLIHQPVNAEPELVGCIAVRRDRLKTSTEAFGVNTSMTE